MPGSYNLYQRRDQTEDEEPALKETPAIIGFEAGEYGSYMMAVLWSVDLSDGESTKRTITNMSKRTC